MCGGNCVIYMAMGLPTHPQHEVVMKQRTGFSVMVSFVINGDLETSKTFVKSLKVTSELTLYCIYSLCSVIYLYMVQMIHSCDS